jgi:hypothetical protein
MGMIIGKPLLVVWPPELFGPVEEVERTSGVRKDSEERRP